MNRTSGVLAQNLGREPRPQELADEMGLPLGKLKQMVKRTEKPVSLDTPISEDQDCYLVDVVEDRSEAGPLESLIDQATREELNAALS